MTVDIRIGFLRYALLQEGHDTFSMIAVGCFMRGRGTRNGGRCGEVTYRWLEFSMVWQFSFSTGWVGIHIHTHIRTCPVICVLSQRLKLPHEM